MNGERNQKDCIGLLESGFLPCGTEFGIEDWILLQDEVAIHACGSY